MIGYKWTLKRVYGFYISVSGFFEVSRSSSIELGDVLWAEDI